MVSDWSENFDAMAEGLSPPTGFEAVAGSPTVFEVDDVKSRSSPHSSKTTSSGSSGYTGNSIARLLSDDGSFVEASFLSVTTSAYYAFRCTSAKTTAAGDIAVNLSFDDVSGTVSRSMAILFYNGSAYVDTGASWASDTWQNMKFIFDFTANTFDLYRDAGAGYVLIQADCSFYNNQSGVSYFMMYVKSGGNTAWFDDIDFDDGTSPPGTAALTVGGNLTIANGATITSSVETLDLDGTTIYTDGNAVKQRWADLTMSGSVTLASDISMHDCDITGTIVGGSYTLDVSGALDLTGATYTLGTSKIYYTGAGTEQFITGAVPLNNFEIELDANDDYIAISGTLDVNGTFDITKGELDINASDPAVNVAGDMTINANGTIEDGSGTITFDGTTTYTDSKFPLVSLGVIVITGTLTLASDILVNDFSGSGTLVGGSYNIEITGIPNFSSLTFTYGTSTVKLSSTSARTFTTGGKTFYNLTVDAATIAAEYTVDGHITVTNDVEFTTGVIDFSTNNDNLTVGGNFTVGASFSFEKGTGKVTFNGTTIYTGDYGLTDIKNVAISATRYYHSNSCIQCDNGDIIVAHQNSGGHSGTDGKVSGKRSTDKGLTFSDDGDYIDLLSATPTAYQVLNTMLGKAPNGDIICWGVTKQRDNTANYFGIVYSISSDNGLNWSYKGFLDPSTPTDALALADGSIKTWGSRMYGVVTRAVWPSQSSILYISDDNGVTWSEFSTIYANGATPVGGNLSYATINQLSNGNLISISYQYATNTNWVTFSTDMGASWSAYQQCTIPGGYGFWACDINVVGDKIFLHGRYWIAAGNGSVNYCTSTDGITFTGLNVIGNITDTENGYTSGVVTSDNQLLIVWSSDRINSDSDLFARYIESDVNMGDVDITGDVALATGLRTDDLVLTGSLGGAGSYDVSVEGNLDITAGVYILSNYTVIMSGSSKTITIPADNNTRFYNLTIPLGADITMDNRIIVSGTQAGIATPDQTGQDVTTISNDLTILGTFRYTLLPGGLPSGGLPFWLTM